MNSNIRKHSTLEQGYDFNILDAWNQNHHFKISTFSLGIKMLSEAIEVISENPDRIPRVFHILSDYDPDVEKAELLLKAKVKKWINRKHLTNADGRLLMTEPDELRGTIEWTDDLSETSFNHVFEVDGKKLTIEEFVNLLEPYGAYKFKFKIYDSSEDFD